MKIFFTLIFVALYFVSFAQPISILKGKNIASIENSKLTGFDISLNTQNIQFQSIKTAEGIFFKAFSDDFGVSLEVGNPELPVFNRLIEIPANAEIEISVVNKKEEIINLSKFEIKSYLFPHQNSVMKNETAEPDFIFNKDEYKKDKFYSLPVASVQYLGEMRGIKLARLSISPFSYNPISNELKIISSISLQVRFLNADIEATRLLKQKTYSSSFQFSPSEILNAETFYLVTPTFQQYAEKYVIVADSAFGQTLKPFVKMKSRQGFKVIEAYLQDSAVGSTKSSIKAYLQGLYNGATAFDPAPAYVLFVGDVTQIQPFTGVAAITHITDLYFCEFTGDAFPEMLYGRFSCEDTLELHNIISKTIEVEDYLMPSTSYLDTSLLVAGTDATYGATYGNGQINYGTSNYYNLSHGIVAKAYLHPASSNAAPQIKSDVNHGVTFLNYTAHGNFNGFSGPEFKNADVANMTNIHKYPIFVGNACLTGKFDANDCFGEVLTNAANKGTVGYIGASDNTYWDEDYYWAVGYSTVSANPTFANSGPGIFDGIFHDHGEAFPAWSINMGQIARKGNLAVTQGGTRVQYYWEVYHVFGDPSLMHYSKVPSVISAIFNPILAIGMDSYNVQTVPYSLVALSLNDSLVSSSYADSTGYATLHFTAFSQISQVLLKITAQNKQPFSSFITVTSPNGPYLNFSEFTVNDSLGNNNQKANNAEQIKLNVTIRNLTNFISGGVLLKLSTNDSSVLITDSLENIALFQGNDTVSLLNAFSLNIKTVVDDGRQVKFKLDISDTANGNWISTFYMPLFAPKLTVGNITVTDALGNGIAEPGESIIYYIEIKNIGNNYSQNGICQLNPQSAVISGNSTANYSILKADSSYKAAFSRQISPNAKVGDICKLNFDLLSSGYHLQKEFYQVVGLVDEDFETGDFSKFKWDISKSKSWKITSTEKFEGNFSSQSDSIGNSDTSSLMLNMNVLVDDSISFYRKVSSEYTYDFLNFYIDNIVAGKWSGNANWQKVVFPISKGMHTLKWEYVKDYFDQSGSDAAWIDYILFPPTDAWTNISEAKSIFEKANLYPNPATVFVNLNFNLKENSDVAVDIYSIDGLLISNIQSSKSYFKGYNSMIISTENISSGNYLVVLKTKYQIYTLKMIILGR